VSKQDAFAYSGSGLLTWLLTSTAYAFVGQGLVESPFWFYALIAFLASGAAALTFLLVLRLRKTGLHDRLLPALAFTLPGLAAGWLLMLFGQPLLAQLPGADLGRYALFLFATYIVVVVHGFETRLDHHTDHIKT
jgi:hypothetical protein